jgi:hypothetical protein
LRGETALPLYSAAVHEGSRSDIGADLERRRREERRAVEEAGGGESEGFELAEAELIEHASHGDEHTPTRILRDAELEVEDEEAANDRYGEGDAERKADA